MTQAKEPVAGFDEVIARPGFDVAMRGYDKRQVDDYVARVAGEISALVAERKRMLAQLHEMGGHLQKHRAELAELQKRPASIERASFRHLGPMVDQILALSEKQGEAIIATANEKAETAEKEAATLREQSEKQLEQAKHDAEALIEAARSQVQQEVEAIRAQTHQELSRQTASHQQQLAAVLHEIEGRQKVLAQLRTEMETAQQRLVQARHEGTAAERDLGQLQQHLGEVSQQLDAQMGRLENARQAAESAERHAKEVRARVQREAERVANLAAQAVMAAAARGAEPTGEFPTIQAAAPGGQGGMPQAAQHANGHAQVPQQREPEPEAQPATPESE